MSSGVSCALKMSYDASDVTEVNEGLSGVFMVRWCVSSIYEISVDLYSDCERRDSSMDEILFIIVIMQNTCNLIG